jgi:hypothetical protein
MANYKRKYKRHQTNIKRREIIIIIMVIIIIIIITPWSRVLPKLTEH